MTTLESLGYDHFFSTQLDLLDDAVLKPARVTTQGRNAWHLAGCDATLGELTGTLLRELEPTARPVVGDWVAVVDSPGNKMGRSFTYYIFCSRSPSSRGVRGRTSDLRRGRQLLGCQCTVETPSLAK